MKHTSIFIAVLLLATVLCSCNRNQVEEDEIIMEDVFEVILLEPNNDVKEKLSESLLHFVSFLPDNFGDTICIIIQGSADWSTLENDNPYSIKIKGIDSSWYSLWINPHTEEETGLHWNSLYYRPILQPVFATLTTGTYTLRCDNCDQSPEKLITRYRDWGWDTTATTDFYIELYFRKQGHEVQAL